MYPPDNTGPRPADLPLPLHLRHWAKNTPDRVFLKEVSGAEKTYLEVAQGVGSWVALFRQLGHGKDSRIGCMLPPCIDAHEVWMAAAWLGAWEVAINNAYKGDMLAHVLVDAEIKTLVIAAEFLESLAGVITRLPTLEHLVVVDGEAPPEVANIPVLTRDDLPAPVDLLQADAPKIAESDVSTVIYTSGTTGPSKGVLLPWGQLAWGVDLFGMHHDGSDVLYDPFPNNHLSGKTPVHACARTGGTVVLKKRFSTSEFWRDICEYGCTATVFLGGIAQFLVNQPVDKNDLVNPLRSSMMAPLVGSFRDFEQRFGLSVTTTYGMSECGWPLLAVGEDIANGDTCGRVRPGWQLRIVDENDDDLPAGKVGELLVRCDVDNSMMKAYLNRPEATEEAWRGGWFHTGDAFRCDSDGNYYFVDRIKDAIRRRGENISSYEVEREVNAHPDIAESAAIAVPAETGEDEVKIVIVPISGKSVDPAALIEFLIPRMPDFMIPRYIESVAELPLTPNTKVRKVVLREAGITAATWDRVAAGVTIK